MHQRSRQRNENEIYDRGNNLGPTAGFDPGFAIEFVAQVPSRFEARATNTNIPATAMPAYREFVYQQGQEFLETVDAWLSAHELADAEAATTPVQRIGLGLYWIQSEPGSESS